MRRAAGGRARGATDADAGLREALLCVLVHDLSGAESALAAIVARDSSRTDAYLALARLYRSRGEIGRAIRIHQNLLLQPELSAPDRALALEGIAADFRAGGFLQRAIAAYEEFLAQSPNDEGSLEALVRLHADARNHPRALELARRLAKRQRRDPRPEEARLLVEMAEAAHAEGRSEDARRALKKALRRAPDHALAWERLGSLEAELGRSKRALDAWSRVPDLDPRASTRIYARLESAYASLGKSREFETFLEKRLHDKPDDHGARLALAGALAARGASDSALTTASELVERDPDDLLAHRARARVLLAAGREQEAAKALREILEALERRGAFASREPLE